MRRGVAVFGATGSIGRSTLSVLAAHPEQFQIEAISAHDNMDRLVEILRAHTPRHLILTNPDQWAAFEPISHQFPTLQVHLGMSALNACAIDPDVDIVVAGIVGAAGLQSTLAAVRAGKQVLLANKEPLVMAGELLMQAARQTGAILLPLDSEHNAIFQCLPDGYRTGETIPHLMRLILTCSGGPFRSTPADQFHSVTPAMACHHPNWQMGAKISVDSATLMNKGLELIEACHLFGVDEAQVDVVIHPESVIHSLVEFDDGSLLAQMGTADMRIPIAFALGYPQRLQLDVPRLDLTQLGRLHFEAPRHADFPAIEMARVAFREGGDRPLVLNAANEAAVAGFLAERIPFTQITAIVSECLNRLARQPISVVDESIVRDAEVRSLAHQLMGTSACS